MESETHFSKELDVLLILVLLAVCCLSAYFLNHSIHPPSLPLLLIHVVLTILSPIVSYQNHCVYTIFRSVTVRVL